MEEPRRMVSASISASTVVRPPKVEEPRRAVDALITASTESGCHKATDDGGGGAKARDGHSRCRPLVDSRRKERGRKGWGRRSDGGERGRRRCGRRREVMEKECGVQRK
uniref:Uncharacterized protein n=1 Tax=Oryza nivara TaxID=4536 RepID=A0A0E0FI82_ORYNI